MCPRKYRYQEVITKSKSQQTLALLGLMMGVGEMDETTSVLNAHLVTCISSEVAVKGFHAATKPFKLLKGKEVFKYLVLFLLWHLCDLH